MRKLSEVSSLHAHCAYHILGARPTSREGVSKVLVGHTIQQLTNIIRIDTAVLEPNGELLLV